MMFENVCECSLMPLNATNIATVTITQLKLGSDLSKPKYALTISKMKKRIPIDLINLVSRLSNNGVTRLTKYPKQKNVKYVPPSSDRGMIR